MVYSWLILPYELWIFVADHSIMTIVQIFGIAIKWPGAVVAAVSRWIKPWRSKRLKYFVYLRIIEKRMGERNKEQKIVFKGLMLEQSLSNVTSELIQHHSRGWKWKKCSICFECFGFAFESKTAKDKLSFYSLGFFVSLCFQSRINFITLVLITYLEDFCSCGFYIQHTDINIFSWICR